MPTLRSQHTGSALHVSVRPQDGVDVVVVVGEIDIATAPQLTAAIDQLLVTGRRHLIVDLEAVTFLDAAALAALITATSAVAVLGGTLQVTHSPRLMALLEFTRETHRIDVATSMQPPAPGARR